MLARRCALSLLLALPAAAEDAMWSGAAPSAAFTGGTSSADATHADAGGHASRMAASDGGAPPVMRSEGVTKTEGVKRVLLKPASTRSDAASPSSATSPDAIYEMAHPPETAESRLTSGWVLVLVVSAVAAFGALAAYALGFFSRGQRVTKRKRAVTLAEDEEQRQDPALPSHVLTSPENMVATTAAPLSIYQLPAAPAPAPMSYAAAPVMMMSAPPAYATAPAPAYATAPAPAYSTAYAMAPAAMAPAAMQPPAAMQHAAMMPFEAPGAGTPPPAAMPMPAMEPLPVPREPLPIA